MEVKSNNDFLICFTSYHGQKFIRALNKILIESNPKEVLYWTPDEWSLPGLYDLDDMSELKKILIDNNILLYVLFGSCKNESEYINKKHYPQHNFEILNWPTYYLHRLQIETNRTTNDFDLLYSNLNNIPHNHRCILMDELSKENLLEFGKVSWNMINPKESRYEFKHWEQKIIEIDNFNSFRIKRNFSNIFYKRDNSLISVITESTTKDMFFSEKTFKPIISERPFIILGHKNQNLELKKYGFELFEEIFDYEFDSKEDVYERAKGIVNNLSNIKNENYNQIFKEVKDKVKHNKKIALDILTKDPYIPNKIKDLKNKFPDQFNNEIGKIIPSFFEKFM